MVCVCVCVCVCGVCVCVLRVCSVFVCVQEFVIIVESWFAQLLGICCGVCVCVCACVCVCYEFALCVFVCQNWLLFSMLSQLFTFRLVDFIFQ